MNKSSIITRLSNIVDNSNELSLIQLYRSSLSPIYIKEIVPIKIYNKYKTELECVNYESFLGDGSYDDVVKLDYITAVKEVIKYLNTYE